MLPGAPFPVRHTYLCNFQLPCLCEKGQHEEIDVTSRTLALSFSWYSCSKYMVLPSIVSLNFSKHSYTEAPALRAGVNRDLILHSIHP